MYSSTIIPSPFLHYLYTTQVSKHMDIFIFFAYNHVAWYTSEVCDLICFFSPKAFKYPHLSNSSTPCHLEQMWSHNNPSIFTGPISIQLPGVECFPLCYSTTFPKGVQVKSTCAVCKSFFCIWILTRKKQLRITGEFLLLKHLHMHILFSSNVSFESSKC